jgi:hypothetical protein
MMFLAVQRLPRKMPSATIAQCNNLEAQQVDRSRRPPLLRDPLAALATGDRSRSGWFGHRLLILLRSSQNLSSRMRHFRFE